MTGSENNSVLWIVGSIAVITFCIGKGVYPNGEGYGLALGFALINGFAANFGISRKRDKFEKLMEEARNAGTKKDP